MNYYEHHIGDYDADTAHLTWAEDMAYTRLIRLYYRREKPIPADIADATRLVRAVGKEQKQAVESVLREFFRLEADGWHQSRCDEEIARYQSGEPEREAKKANEETRLRRHREERAALFQRLTENGVHAAWNIGIKELRALVEKLPQPLPATAPATPATATQTPDTNPQTPTTSVPIGTGGKPPMSPDEIIFGYGVPLLVNAGSADKAARSFLGGLRKGHGDEAVVDALRNCLREKPLQPLEWLAAVLPPAGSKPKPNAQEALEASNRAVANRFLAQQEAAREAQ